jgi:hypothetical protein
MKAIINYTTFFSVILIIGCYSSHNNGDNLSTRQSKIRPFSKIHFCDNSGYTLLETDSAYDMQWHLYAAFVENNCSDSMKYDDFHLYIPKKQQESRTISESHRDSSAIILMQRFSNQCGYDYEYSFVSKDIIEDSISVKRIYIFRQFSYITVDYSNNFYGVYMSHKTDINKLKRMMEVIYPI